MTTNKKEPEAAGMRLDEEMLREYLDSLVPKLNHRLLEAMESGTGSSMAQVLQVESITLTAYEPENDIQKGR